MKLFGSLITTASLLTLLAVLAPAAQASQTFFFDPLKQNIELHDQGPGRPLTLVVDGSTQIRLETASSKQIEYSAKLNYYRQTLEAAKSRHLKIAVCSQCTDKPVNVLLTSIPSDVPLSDAKELDLKLQLVEKQLAELRNNLKTKAEDSPSIPTQLRKNVSSLELISNARAGDDAAGLAIGHAAK